MTALLATAFAAGMVATVNPCGFAMLPAYLGMLLGEKDRGRGHALMVGVAVSSGFVAVFLITGALVAAGLRTIVTWIPWVAALIGVGLVVAGIAQLRGASLFARLPGMRSAHADRSLKGLVGFGASYGVASLSCTLPIFLSIIAGTLATDTIAESLTVLAAYGAGMSLVVIVLTLALAAGRDRVRESMRSVSTRLETISGWVMIVAGAFIVWYWATVLVSGASVLGSNPFTRSIDEFTAYVAGIVAANPIMTGLVVALVGLVIWGKAGGGGDTESRQPAKQAPGDGSE